MNAQGIVLVVAGVGLLWSARANADVVSAVSSARYRAMSARGWPRWAIALLAPRPNRSRRVLTASNYILGSVVLLAGVLNVVGVWRV